MTSHHRPALWRTRHNSLACSDIDILPDLLEECTSDLDSEDAQTEPYFPEIKETDSTQADLELGQIPIPMPEPSLDSEKESKYVVYADKDSYEYVAHRTTAKPTNSLESMGLLIKGCLGAGILGLHEAYMKCGLWTSVFVTIFFGFYMAYCIHILVRSAHTLYKRLHLPAMSYSDLAEAALEVGPFPKLKKFSKCFRFAVDFTIVVDLFGVCCVYQIIIAKTIKEITGNSQETMDGDLDQLRFYILTLLVPILILCLITSLKYLASFSLLADIFIVISIIATVFYGLQSAPKIHMVRAWTDTTSLFELCGAIVFSMGGVGVALPIENNMKDPTKYPTVLWSGMSTVVLFLILIGFFGTWGFGDKTVLPAALNNSAEIFPLVLKCMMNIMIFVTFALNFWAPFNIIWHYLRQWHNPQKYWLWERIYRTIFVIIITSIAVAFPYIGDHIRLLGAFCLSIIGFICPALIDLLVVWETPGLGRYKWRLWTNIFTIIIGMMLLLATSYSIRELYMNLYQL